MPIIYDIEPEEDDESKYRCWMCWKLLDDVCFDMLCPECREIQRQQEEINQR